MYCSSIMGTSFNAKVHLLTVLEKRRGVYSYPVVLHGSWSGFWDEIFGRNEFYSSCKYIDNEPERKLSILYSLL